MFHNSDGPAKRFYQSSYVYGLDWDHDGRASAPVDIDGDGDLDLALLTLQGLRLMENTSPRKHFARIRLKATRSQHHALSAIVRVKAGGVTRQDYVHMTDGYQAQVPLELHFGLGSVEAIESIEVDWPSGAKQTWKSPAVDKLIVLTEGDDSAVASALPHWPAETRPKVKPAFSFDIEAKNLEGSESTIAKAGRPVVVNFWAPTCVGCKDELPILADLWKKHAQDVDFIGISAELENLASVRETAKSFGTGYPQFLANDKLFLSFFGTSGEAALPTTFVFDRKGSLRRVFRRTIGSQELESLLISLRDEGIFSADYEVLAGNFMKQGNYQLAEVNFRKALDLAPRSTVAIFGLGIVQMSSGKLEEAIATLQHCIEVDPDHVDAHYNLAVGLHKRGLARESLVHYSKGLKSREKDVDVLLLYGSAAAEALDTELARKMFSQAVLVEPTNARAHTWMAKLQMFLKEYDEARKSLERALALNPDFPDAKTYMRKLIEETGGRR